MNNYKLDAEDNEFSAFWLNDNHLIIKEDDKDDIENDSPELPEADKSDELH